MSRSGFLSSVTVEPENGNSKLFNTFVRDMQTGVTVSDGAITGTLKYLDDGGEISGHWGAGNFLCLKFKDIDDNATSVKVGLEPSEGSGLVEIINNPDKNGVFKITDKDTQKFVIVSTNGAHTERQEFDLSGLTVESE